ncbi:MAG: peptide deformylase [Holosporaceae bacterium]|jgi:peptide deformylase|nr:peptide deformylase [Holosporaceae bacterium]
MKKRAGLIKKICVLLLTIGCFAAKCESKKEEARTPIVEMVSDPDPILSKECSDVLESELPEAREIAAVLEAWVKDPSAHLAALAAPQIGKLKRIIVVQFGLKGGKVSTLAMINPEIVEKSDALSTEIDACASLPDVLALTSRSLEIIVKYRDLDFKIKTVRLTGFDAFAAQHEICHLNGKNFIDHQNVGESQRKEILAIYFDKALGKKEKKIKLFECFLNNLKEDLGKRYLKENADFIFVAGGVVILNKILELGKEDVRLSRSLGKRLTKDEREAILRAIGRFSKENLRKIFRILLARHINEG